MDGPPMDYSLEPDELRAAGVWPVMPRVNRRNFGKA
jgi:hypothetical protein